jgi:hypothetical protein
VKFIGSNTAFLVGICLLISPLYAADGILLVQKETGSSGVRTNQIQIEKDRMRIENSGSGERQAFVFNGAKQVLWIINFDKKTYNEMTKEEIDRLGGQMTDAMATMKAQMEERMKNMPPEQRQRMEEMMRGRMPGGGAMPSLAKTDYRKVGTERVGKWTCDKYEGYQNNQKKSEVCTVDPKDLGFTASDFEVTRQLAEFFKKLMPQNADQMFSIGKSEDQGFSGVPVKRVVYMGQQQTVSEVTDVRRESFPASTFEVPSGFQKQAFGPGAGRR